MSEPLEQSQRQVVPRWRDFRDAIRVGELGSSGSRPPEHQLDDAHLRAAREIWERAINKGNETLARIVAPDVMGNALLLGRPHEAADVARHVLDSGSDASPLVEHLAHRVMRTQGEQQPLELPVPSGTVEIEEAAVQVRLLRHRLAANPHNPIGWVELARAYTITGATEKATRAITVALGRGNENRFVLRAAARFFVHLEQPDRAVRVLSGTDAGERDPWLLASELAITHLSGQRPRSTRRARRLATDNAFSPFERSELLSAIATLELSSGSDKRARKLFAASLVDPHENSLAQVEWASERVARIHVSSELLETPDSYEARARDAAQRGAWDEALQQTLYWQHAEPFSVEAAIHGSYVAAVGLGDFLTGRDIARQGLASNPSSAVLRNNLAYAEANLGSLEAATEQLRLMRSLVEERRLQVPYLATSGLVAYRSGDFETGRSFYHAAVEAAEKLPDASHVQALVWAHFAQEELRIRGDQRADLVQQAQAAAKGWQRADIRALLLRIEQLSRDAGHL